MYILYIVTSGLDITSEMRVYHFQKFFEIFLNIFTANYNKCVKTISVMCRLSEAAR